MAKIKKTTTQTMVHQTLHRKHDWAIQTLIKTRDALRYVRQLYSSCFIGGTRCVTHVNNPVMSHEWGINGIWPRQTEHFLSHLWYRHSVTVTNGHDNVRITFEVMTSTLLLGNHDYIASLLVAIQYHSY